MKAPVEDTKPAFAASPDECVGPLVRMRRGEVVDDGNKKALGGWMVNWERAAVVRTGLCLLDRRLG